MKKIIITTLAFAVIASAPAHAISAQYRAQLERSGCNMENAGKTCDIYKTKAQNSIAQPTINTAPYHGKWAVFTEDKQELPDLELNKAGVVFGGDRVDYAVAPAIADGALYLTLSNKMSVTLKKNGGGRWVSPESSGYLQRK